MIKALMYWHNNQDYEWINKNLLNEIPRAYKLDNRWDVLGKLKKYTGKDWVYYKNWRWLEQFVTWSEWQAKYSDRNIGTYDMDNPDMKFQKYWTANPNEKGISATEWLNIRNFKNW
jgi:hypothetical protein